MARALLPAANCLSRSFPPRKFNCDRRYSHGIQTSSLAQDPLFRHARVMESLKMGIPEVVLPAKYQTRKSQTPAPPFHVLRTSLGLSKLFHLWTFLPLNLGKRSLHPPEPFHLRSAGPQRARAQKSSSGCRQSLPCYETQEASRKFRISVSNEATLGGSGWTALMTSILMNGVPCSAGSSSPVY